MRALSESTSPLSDEWTTVTVSRPHASAPVIPHHLLRGQEEPLRRLRTHLRLADWKGMLIDETVCVKDALGMPHEEFTRGGQPFCGPGTSRRHDGVAALKPVYRERVAALSIDDLVGFGFPEPVAACMHAAVSAASTRSAAASAGKGSLRT